MHVDQIEGLVLLKAQSTIIRLSIDHRTKDFIFIINCEILKYAICQHETASCLLKTLSEIFQNFNLFSNFRYIAYIRRSYSAYPTKVVSCLKPN